MKRLCCALLTVVFAFGAVSFAAAADKKAADPEAAFKKMDKNSDGKVSEEEFVGKRTGEKADKAKTQFGKMDANKDGNLSLEEFKAKGKKKSDK